jgi:ABC-type branched-subunit amino acid transport system permease subunit
VLFDGRLGRACIALREDEGAAACAHPSRSRSFILTMVVLGGLGSIWGVVGGRITVSTINHYLLPSVLCDVPRKVGLHFNLAEISSGIYRFLLLIIMLL